MKSILTTLLILAGSLTTTFAGGYHCGLKVESLTFQSPTAFELTVTKVEADRALYQQDLHDWEMVSESVGNSFQIVFDLELMDDKSIDCLNAIILAAQNKSVLEFGFGDTAIKKNEQGKYQSKYLLWYHKAKDGQICVHGE